MSKGREPLYFHPSCTKDFRALPESVQDDAGHNLDRVQQGSSRKSVSTRYGASVAG